MKCGLLIFIIFSMVQQGESQVLKKLSNKLQSKAIEEKSKKTDSKSAFESGMFGNADGGMDLSGLMGQTKDFKAPSSYTFDFQVTMEMGMEKGENMTQVWKYSTKDSFFAMEISGMLIIYDLESDMMVTLNPKEETYTAMSTSMMGMIGNAADEDDSSMPEMIKTSETKMILGYKATKYIMEDETMKGEFWMAPDVNFDQASFAKSIGSYSKKQVALPEKMQGFMMEMNAFDKKRKSTSQLKVIQLGEINEVIDMSQYKNGMAF
jgi:hypothetical protein